MEDFVKASIWISDILVLRIQSMVMWPIHIEVVCLGFPCSSDFPAISGKYRDLSSRMSTFGAIHVLPPFQRVALRSWK